MQATGSIGNLHELISAVEATAQALNNSRLWWRGEPRVDDWRLRPKMFRKECHPLAEAHVLMSFKKGATARYSACPRHDDTVGWMFLAQHHGAPTRLLDWTESPLIAAFFAVAADPDAPGRLWGLCPFAMNNGVFGEAAIVQPGRYPAAELVATAWNGKKPNADSPTVTAIVASENSQRMLMQLGAFTIHGVRTPLDDYPNAERFLRCYDVPAAAKKPLAAQLARAGIRRSSLFPDLDNLSAEIAATHVDGWPVGAPPAIETLAEPIGGSVVVGDV